MTDASGATSSFGYDSEQRLTRQLLPNGDEKTFEYNENGKISATTENGERTEIVQGNEAGNQTESRNHKNGKNVKSVFNKRAQETHLQVEGGVTVDNEYDAKGRQTASVYSDSGRIERNFDAAGRKTSEKLSSGFIHNYEYNAKNQLVRQSNSRGHSMRVDRDAGGNIIKFTNQDNNWVQVIRDDAGRIVQLKNSRGQSRSYKYNSRGALTGFVGADGRDLQFQYNERGELLDIANAQNGRLIYQRNPLNNLAKILPQGNLWQMQKISYASSFTKKADLNACAFGDGFDSFNDGWDYWDAEFEADSGGGCSDPFGGGSSYGGGDFGGETCEQCISRQHRIDDDHYDNCLARYVLPAAGAGAYGGGKAGVEIGTYIEPGYGTVIGGVVGGALGGIGGAGSAYLACNFTRDAEYEGAIDNCPICKG